MTNLTAVSTFGWYTESSGSDLTAISTFGWWLGDEIVVVDYPDIYCVTLNIHSTHAFEVCR